MKSVKPSTRTLKRPRGEVSTVALASGDQRTTEEIPMNPTAAMDPTTIVDPTTDDTINSTVTSPLSLHAMMKTFMTTQAAHGQLINELLIVVAALRVDFAKYRSVFPPLPPSDP